MAKENVLGIDVSHHNGKIDWRKVAQAGIRFAFIKATEGVSFVDSCYARNVKEAQAAGILVGAYHYFRPQHTGTAQARHFLEVVGDTTGMLPPVLDVEEAGTSSATVRARSREWLESVARAVGRKPIVYTYVAFVREHLGKALVDYPLWIACWRNTPPANPLDGTWRWYWWQYTDRGRVAGISGHVDKNIFNGSLEELQAWVSHEAPPVQGTRPVRVILLPANKELAVEAVYADGKVRCGLRALAEALGYTVTDKIKEQGKVYIAPAK